METSSTSKSSKEEVDEIFDEIVFFFVDEPEDLEDLTEKIEEHGGFVATSFSKRVTHVVTENELTEKQMGTFD
jgi:hypothetical protein